MSELRRKLSNLLGVAVGFMLAAGVLGVVWCHLVTSDLSWLPSFHFTTKKEQLLRRYVARFQRQRDAAAVEEDIGALRCSLTPWAGPGPDVAPAPDLRLELTNMSDEAVRLWYTSGAECHVTFLVCGKGQDVYGSFCFGGRAALPASFDSTTGRPEPLPPILVLQPGETHTVAVHLLDIRNGCSGPRVSGTYKLVAVFLYEDLDGYPEPGQRFLARSQPIAIELVGPLAGTRPTWRLSANSP